MLRREVAVFFAPGFRESWSCEEGEILSLVVELEKTQLWRSLPSCVRTGMGYEMMISSTQPVQWISLMRDNSILHDMSYRPRQLRMLRKTAARTGISWISLGYDQTIQGRSTWVFYCQHTCWTNKMSGEKRRNYVISILIYIRPNRDVRRPDSTAFWAVVSLRVRRQIFFGFQEAFSTGLHYRFGHV